MGEYFHIEHPEYVHLVWAIPFLAGLYTWGFWRKGKALRVFASVRALGRLNVSVHRPSQIAKAIMVLCAFLLLAAAAMQPGWDPYEETIRRKGRDVVFLLDCSRSMLADDLRPSRLERSKLAIGECLDRMEGDRVGLVIFAGASQVACPLTHDHGFFRMLLHRVTTESLAQGGTLIGDAIRRATDDVFETKEKEYKDILLITDGEDHDSFPVRAAERAAAQGVRIFTVGIGGPEGRRIPVVDERGNRTYLTYQGKEVVSRLDANTLRKIAHTTPEGRYIPVETGDVRLGEIYEKVIASPEQRDLASDKRKRWRERYAVFLGAALALLCCESLVSERKKRRGLGYRKRKQTTGEGR